MTDPLPELPMPPNPYPPYEPPPMPIMPPAQVVSNLLTPGQQPLCYSPHPDTGRLCNLTMYHPGNHRCVAVTSDTYTDFYTYWSTETAPGPIPDPNPPPELPLLVPEPIPPEPGLEPGLEPPPDPVPVSPETEAPPLTGEPIP